MRKPWFWLVIALLLAAWWWPHQRQAQNATAPLPTPAVAADTQPPSPVTPTRPAYLPPEVHDTLGRIARGGPFVHPQDGDVFGNREGHLPAMPRGYYHEYTVETPGLDNRGARRIITGGDPPVAYYYTDDHYNNFRALELQR